MRDSRRARLILGTLLAVALVALTVDHRTGAGSPFWPLRHAGAWLFGTVERTAGSITRPIGDFLQALAGAAGARDEIERLEAENAKLRTELIGRRLDATRSAELRRMLGLSGRGGYEVVSANVIARRGSPGFEDAIQIDAGTADGVRPEMTVINGDGLVGRVVSATDRTATAVLISDPGASTGARLEGGREIGVVHGMGEYGRQVRFRLLDSTTPLAPGTRIVSFGSQNGTPYVPGVPIGVIDRVEATPGELTRVAFARPYADLTALDVVGVVVRGPRRDPRDAVLPPKQPEKDAEADAEAVRSPGRDRRKAAVAPDFDPRDAALGQGARGLTREPTRDRAAEGDVAPGTEGESGTGRDAAPETGRETGVAETGPEPGAVRTPARTPVRGEQHERQHGQQPAGQRGEQPGGQRAEQRGGQSGGQAGGAGAGGGTGATGTGARDERADARAPSRDTGRTVRAATGRTPAGQARPTARPAASQAPTRSPGRSRAPREEGGR
jgi:rod shape-determining protein MreC